MKDNFYTINVWTFQNSCWLQILTTFCNLKLYFHHSSSKAVVLLAKRNSENMIPFALLAKIWFGIPCVLMMHLRREKWCSIKQLAIHTETIGVVRNASNFEFSLFLSKFIFPIYAKCIIFITICEQHLENYEYTILGYIKRSKFVINIIFDKFRCW